MKMLLFSTPLETEITFHIALILFRIFHLLRLGQNQFLISHKNLCLSLNFFFSFSLFSFLAINHRSDVPSSNTWNFFCRMWHNFIFISILVFSLSVLSYPGSGVTFLRCHRIYTWEEGKAHRSDNGWGMYNWNFLPENMSEWKIFIVLRWCLVLYVGGSRFNSGTVNTFRAILSANFISGLCQRKTKKSMNIDCESGKFYKDVINNLLRSK